MKKDVWIIFIVFCFTGITGRLYSKPPIKLVQFLLTPNHSNWNYNLNESASVDITVLKYGVPVPGAIVDYQYGKEIVGLNESTGKLD